MDETLSKSSSQGFDSGSNTGKQKASKKQGGD